MRRIIRRAALAPTILALAFAAVAVGSPAASASSGGGCDPDGPVSYGGFSVKACISASYDNLIADAWASGSTSAECYMYIEIVDASYNIIARSGDQNCTSGHHNGTSKWEAYGTYQSAACLVVGYVPRGCSFSRPISNP